MNPKTHKTLTEIANGNPFNVRTSLLNFLETVEVEKEEIEKPKKQRTLTQNGAMWLAHQKVADELTKAGVSMRRIFEETQTFDIPPTKDNVHDLWLYFQKIMYPTMPSTKDLPKHGDHYQKIHDVMMKNLGEKWHIDYVDFPSEENITFFSLEKLKSGVHDKYY